MGSVKKWIYQYLETNCKDGDMYLNNLSNFWHLVVWNGDNYLIKDQNPVVSSLPTFVPDSALLLLASWFPYMAIRLGRGVPWALEKNSELLKTCFGWITSLLQLKNVALKTNQLFCLTCHYNGRILISQCLNLLFQLWDWIT